MNDSPGAAGLRRAWRGDVGGVGGGVRHWPPSPSIPPGEGRSGHGRGIGPLPVSKKTVPACPPLSVPPRGREVRCGERFHRERQADEALFRGASLPSARASVSRGCLGNLSVDLPGAECKSSPEEMHQGLSACQRCVCVAQQSFL